MKEAFKLPNTDIKQPLEPGEARKRIYIWLQGTGWEMGEPRYSQLRALLKAYANSVNEKLQQRLQRAQDEVYQLKVKYGELHPTTTVHQPNPRDAIK